MEIQRAYEKKIIENLNKVWKQEEILNSAPSDIAIADHITPSYLKKKLMEIQRYLRNFKFLIDSGIISAEKSETIKNPELEEKLDELTKITSVVEQFPVDDDQQESFLLLASEIEIVTKNENLMAEICRFQDISKSEQIPTHDDFTRLLISCKNAIFYHENLMKSHYVRTNYAVDCTTDEKRKPLMNSASLQLNSMLPNSQKLDTYFEKPRKMNFWDIKVPETNFEPILIGIQKNKTMNKSQIYRHTQGVQEFFQDYYRKGLQIVAESTDYIALFKIKMNQSVNGLKLRIVYENFNEDFGDFGFNKRTALLALWLFSFNKCFNAYRRSKFELRKLCVHPSYQSKQIIRYAFAKQNDKKAFINYVNSQPYRPGFIRQVFKNLNENSRKKQARMKTSDESSKNRENFSLNKRRRR